MGLLRPDQLDADQTAYRIFGLGRDSSPWKASDVIGNGPFTDDERLAEQAWKVSSRGYYAEQAGLIAAATLATQTEDAALRFSLATAVSDEARHADAFYQYARKIGGEPEECQELLEPLHQELTRLPYLGKALVHTMLEGIAADEFIILSHAFGSDPLGKLYHHVRRDEIRHIAIGLSYLARESTTPAGRDAWHEYSAQWLEIGARLTALEGLSAWLAQLTGRDANSLQQWFLRRHRARLKAAGIRI
ncbi:ferritin-like domain-containing protein [Amycolatopsis sp. NPDC054798]